MGSPEQDLDPQGAVDPDITRSTEQHAARIARHEAEVARIAAGGARKYHARLAEQNKLFVRERIRRLLDGPMEVEDGFFAECESPDLPADGSLTGIGRVGGRPVAVMAADATVKAGSWGPKGVEKVIRLQETAMKLKLPMVLFVDSAGARITEQMHVFPGRRAGGKIFYNQIRMSGVVPQVCVLFGPSPAGAAYVPAFSDVVVMVDGATSAYLASPRMAEMAIGEKVTAEEMGGARMHCTVSGLGDYLAKDEDDAIAFVRRLLSYLPAHCGEMPPVVPARAPASRRSLADIIPESDKTPFDMHEVIAALVDAESFLEIKKLYAPELITGLARIHGKVVGVVANQSKVKAGTLFSDSSDKGARFCALCNAYNIPLLFLSDVPGYMIGSQVERTGIIRHGAKFIAAMSQATVPKICVVVRKCFGAGLYAMAGPAFGTDATLALPNAQIAVMGPEAAINAVYANVIAELPAEERAAFVAEKRAEYAEYVDIYKLASELHVDHVVNYDALRGELGRRYALYETKDEVFAVRRNPVYPV
jgi:acetyl-CoA carboxylase carboxyltransferase component